MSTTTVKRFKIGETVYEFATSSDVTLRDLLELERDSAELGRSLNMGEIVRLGDLFQSLTPEESRVHPESGWMFAVTIWMSMVKRLRDAGDFKTRVAFTDCLDFNLAEFVPLKDPTDRQAGGPGKARKAAKKSAPKASRPVAAPAEPGSGESPEA